jgi:hypothetical protein
MIINCKILVNPNSEIEKEETMKDIGVDIYPECMWNERSVDVHEATGFSKYDVESPDEYPDSCAEGLGCAVFHYGHYEMITNIPYEVMALWWKHKRTPLELEYDEKEKILMLLF